MKPEEAIRILEVAKAECEWNAPLEYQGAFDAAIEALRQPEPCEDAVSRKSILEKISKKDNWEKYDRYNIGLSDARQIVQDESPVTPRRKKGKWIMKYKGYAVTSYKCSECGRTVKDDTGYSVSKDYPFCHCGADMRGEQDGR